MKKNKKVALITGVTGQDGSYLTEILLSKGYEVHGVVRRASSINTGRIDHIFDPDNKKNLHYGDLSDGIDHLLYELQPDEVYNLGAMSHVKISFDIPIYTGDVTGLGATRILEGIRKMGLTKKTKFYQASSSEMFGITPPPQSENSPFNPVSPYGCAKLYAYHMTKAYRMAYGMFATNGILFNHESPRRGETFVTKKITHGLARIKLGKEEKLYLGNLDAKRDWGYAKDFVYGMWLILQHKKPDDFLLATNESHSVREFVEEVGKILDMNIVWKGKGLNEKGIDKKTGKIIIEIDEKYFRPAEVDILQGDYSKAKRELGWKPTIKFKELIKLMAEADLEKERHTI